MAGAVALHVGGDHAARFEGKAATRETPLVKWTIIGLALTFFAIFLLLPLLAVFVEAFRKGPHIFNLGHGITPDADPENVRLMIDTIRGA